MISGKATNNDTIVAQATPRGLGAIAMVRLSGEKALDIAAAMVRAKTPPHDWESHQVHLVEITQRDGSPLDQALCVIYRQPHSYTGEDVVEFFLHGSPYIAAKTIERCCELGARNAGPGEFTQRAFLNGRMDLAQAEAVADLIAASSEAAHRTAISQREGTLSRRIRDIRDRLLEMCSLAELDIDFSDQDVRVIQPDKDLARLDEIEKDLKNLEGSFKRGRLQREGATVAIAGAPNVGKSTLFNALLGEEKAIVDESPGTTRDAVEGLVEWGGLAIRLMDTAGQAEHFLGPDRQAVDRARKESRAADVVLWVLDISRAEEQELPREEISERVIVIGNKADLIKPGSGQFSSNLQVSALHGIGLDELKSMVLKKLLPEGSTAALTDGILTRARHLEEVQKALGSLCDARHVAAENRGVELLAEDLRGALRCLDEIVGEVTTDDVLNRIFADFCIGK